MNHHPIIRTIYLYIFTLLGLVLLIIGGVRFINMGLKAFVFTRAEDEQRLMYSQFYNIPYPIERVEKLQEEEFLSEEEKDIIKQWLKDYADWKEKESQIDPVTTRRHNEASLSFSLILIGLPLYLYHWRIIKKETKNKVV
ncbi:MAG: hypothetical protein PHN37_02090 [Candidatus Pacebacteria bacterium]|nr:hypothetical protein [Candidatus Paceibacterota bacterium]